MFGIGFYNSFHCLSRVLILNTSCLCTKLNNKKIQLSDFFSWFRNLILCTYILRSTLSVFHSHIVNWLCCCLPDKCTNAAATNHQWRWARTHATYHWQCWWRLRFFFCQCRAATGSGQVSAWICCISVRVWRFDEGASVWCVPCGVCAVWNPGSTGMTNVPIAEWFWIFYEFDALTNII